MDRLFVVNKPVGRSSNGYLKHLKWRYKEKKAGFSGTLDPFACGCLIVAFGKYTQLFQYLKKAPKSYRTTIWLGVQSESLDNCNIYSNEQAPRLDVELIKNELAKLVGELSYLPPKYSAKRINGQRAYELAVAGLDVKLKEITSIIYDVKFINYNHPFISFDISVSEGSYIRSIAQVLLERLEQVGTLSYLERLNEGDFKFDNEVALNPLDYLDFPKIEYYGDKEWLGLGRPLYKKFFQEKPNGEYLVIFDDFFAIVRLDDEDQIKYVINKVPL